MFAPVPLVRRNHIMDRLRKAGALSPETAVTFRGARVINPDCFRRVTRMMIKTGLLGQTGDRYYAEEMRTPAWGGTRAGAFCYRDLS